MKQWCALYVALYSYLLSPSREYGTIVIPHITHIIVTSKWAQWRPKSPASPLFTQPFIEPQIKELPKHCVTGLCAGNSPLTGEFPAHMASNEENVSIWWRHHDTWQSLCLRLLVRWVRFPSQCFHKSFWMLFILCQISFKTTNEISLQRNRRPKIVWGKLTLKSRVIMMPTLVTGDTVVVITRTTYATNEDNVDITTTFFSVLSCFAGSTGTSIPVSSQNSNVYFP